MVLLPSRMSTIRILRRDCLRGCDGSQVIFGMNPRSLYTQAMAIGRAKRMQFTIKATTKHTTGKLSAGRTKAEYKAATPALRRDSGQNTVTTRSTANRAPPMMKMPKRSTLK